MTISYTFFYVSSIYQYLGRDIPPPPPKKTNIIMNDFQKDSVNIFTMSFLNFKSAATANKFVMTENPKTIISIIKIIGRL